MNEEFIKNLASQGAKKPIYRPNKQLFLWSMIMLFYAALIFGMLGIRQDISQRMHDLFFDLEILLVVITSFSAAIAASFLALPDINQKYSIKWIPLFPFFLLCLVIFYQYFTQGTLTIDQICMGASYKCAMTIVIFSIVPSAIFFAILFRTATLNNILAGFMIGLCGGSFSYLLLRLIHSTEDVIHLFLWHFVPVFLVTLISMITAKFVIKRV